MALLEASDVSHRERGPGRTGTRTVRGRLGGLLCLEALLTVNIQVPVVALSCMPFYLSISFVYECQDILKTHLVHCSPDS